jgi:hypothetical protein
MRGEEFDSFEALFAALKQKKAAPDTKSGVAHDEEPGELRKQAESADYRWRPDMWPGTMRGWGPITRSIDGEYERKKILWREGNE